MILLIDSGNTRLKWRLDDSASGEVFDRGYGMLTHPDPLAGVTVPDGRQVKAVAVSTVASEQRRQQLVSALESQFQVPVTCYWAEQARGGLVSAYQRPETMGADRWHAMYAAWQARRQGFAVVDAGSAVTVDYVAADGQHLGGFILPGLQMMLRSLSQDAARIGFEPEPNLDVQPGRSTNQCVNHGLAWLTAALIERIHMDLQRFDLHDCVITGGDAVRMQRLGLRGQLVPELVLNGLAQIRGESLVASEAADC